MPTKKKPAKRSRRPKIAGPDSRIVAGELEIELTKVKDAWVRIGQVAVREGQRLAGK